VPFLEACRRRFGATFTLRMAGLPPIVVLSDPAAVKEVIAGDPEAFHAGAANLALKPTTWLRSFGRGSLLLLDGDRHRRERKLMMPAFHGERMLAYRRVMLASTNRAIESWPRGRPFALHACVRDLLLDIFIETIFGLEEGPRRSEIRRALVKLRELEENMGLLFLAGRTRELRGRAFVEHLFRVPAQARFQRTVDQVDAEIGSEIRRRRAARAVSRDDVLAMLLTATDEEGRGLDDASLVDEMKTLLFAGQDATADALTWMMLELLQQPHILARLERELAEDDEYLDAVIRETLRLHAVVPLIARKLSAPREVGGHGYPAGTVLAPSIHLLQREPTLFPDPGRFDPERFLGSKLGAYEFAAFGGGARRCLGMAFALFEMRIVLRQLVTRGNLRLAPHYRPRAVPRGISLVVAEGLSVVRDA
jgi:cytochrome P450